MRSAATRALVSAAALLIASAAHAGEVRLAKIAVKGSDTKGDAVSVSGLLTTPGLVAAPAEVRFRCGEFEQVLAAPGLVRSDKGLSYKAPKGTVAGVTKFSLSVKTGKFSLAARGVEVGSLAVPVTLALDVGGQRTSALVPLSVSNGSGGWKAGQPLQTVLVGRVLQVGFTGGNTVLGPAGGALFVRSDVEEPPAPQASVVGGTGETDADGYFDLTLQYTDPGVLRNLDLGFLLGETDALTRPGTVPGTPGEDGELRVVTFVQERSGAGGEVSPSAESVFEVEGEGAAGTLTVPAGAVPAMPKRSTAATVGFTPYEMAAEFPAPLPAGYRALAGAEVTCGEPLTFDPAHRPTVELSRPSWTERDSLDGLTIRLLQYVEGVWVVQPGEGFYNEGTDRFEPDPFDPAGLSVVAPVAYGAEVVAEAGTVTGTVLDDEGQPVAGQTVLTRSGGVVTGADGGFEVPASTLETDSLEVLQVVGETSSAALVVSAEEAAEAPVTLEVAGEEPATWMVGVVQGTVMDGGTGQPVEGAVVTLSLAGLVRGLSHDDGGTPGNFADDLFSVPNLGALGVLAYEWSLYTPGQSEPFVSTVHVKNAVSPTLLMLEAQGAGRGIADGAYTVRLRYTLPYLGLRELYGGFRVTTVGLDLTVSDIALPAGYEPSPSVTAVADSLGEYSKFYRAPEGIPMTARGDCPGGNVTNTRSFVFDSLVTVDLETDGPPPPAGLQVGWNVLSPMPVERNYAILTSLGGKVYAAGANTRRVDVYDPATDSWTRLADANSLHQGSEGVAAGGRVWAIAGRDSSAIEQYDTLLNTWTTKAAMTWPREHCGAAVLNGKIVVAGGCREHWENVGSDLTLALSHVEQYDIAANAWTALESLPTAVIFGQAAVVDGTLYLAGGWRADTMDYSQDVLAYSPLTDTWTARSPMPSLRYRGACGVIDGEIWYTGGSTLVPGGPQLTSTIYIYNPANDTWRRGPDMPTTRTQHGATVAGGVLYITGGADTVSHADQSLWAYRPE